ncbi:MAG TPA: ATP-binding cassette domain-containing protein, partial [Thermoanaerobaculia bacterium]|nr:ATP-binding cassette domain-containing protein [Thermoanaerobaculia bacterium]
QESFLFSASIRENIGFGRPGATDDEILEAARLAGLGSDLSQFPNGLDTIVGERGITLSGGQKQRVALARALLRRPRILLLDDCLSAVDTHTEEQILRNLRTVFEGRTVFLVSHRISTVKDADLILVLDQGRIAERGTHAQLLAHGGLYADLHQRQLLEEELAAV